MDQKESINEEETETNNSWLVSVEPEVEIQESEPSIEVVKVEEDAVEQQLSCESDEENDFHAVQEYETVLVDKICEVCGNPFQAFELVNSESNQKPQLTTCQMCSYYITPHSMEIENQDTEGGKFCCDKCPKSFIRKDRLDRHQVTHSESRPFTCKMCEKTFKRSDKLVEHIKITHRAIKNGWQGHEMEIMCDVCGDVDGVITATVRDNKAAFVNLCEVCNLSRQERMNDPAKKESKLFQCDLCSRYFSRKDHASRHRLSHLDVKPFECYICEKSFNRNDRLLRHMKIHPNAKPFSCKVCAQSFTCRDELRSHQAVHPIVKTKRHKCEICQKAFKDKDKLQRHLTTHVDYKPYSCELCGKSFKLQATLLSHQQVHSNWKPFKCETCGMAFKIRETYKRHLLVHSSVTMYTCHICSKSFKRSDKLKAHHLVHVDSRPFACDLCKSSFKRKDKYVRHRKQVHGIQRESSSELELDVQTELIVCEMCGKSFNCEDDLTEHKMVHYR